MKSSLVKISHTCSTCISVPVTLQALTSSEHSVANTVQMISEYKVADMNQPYWGVSTELGKEPQTLVMEDGTTQGPRMRAASGS